MYEICVNYLISESLKYIVKLKKKWFSLVMSNKLTDKGENPFLRIYINLFNKQAI